MSYIDTGVFILPQFAVIWRQHILYTIQYIINGRVQRSKKQALVNLMEPSHFKVAVGSLALIGWAPASSVEGSEFQFLKRTPGLQSTQKILSF